MMPATPKGISSQYEAKLAQPRGFSRPSSSLKTIIESGS